VDLPHVACTFNVFGFVERAVDSRKEERGNDGDHTDHGQKLHERKTDRLAPACSAWFHEDNFPLVLRFVPMKMVSFASLH
jgi:hypothetical protein